MTKVTIVTLCVFLFVLGESQHAYAKPSLNDMQSCQALISFLAEKVEAVPSYSQVDKGTVKKGLEAYNNYIQQTVVAPALSQLSSGDKAQAATLKNQIDAYKKSLIKTLDSRYSQPKLVMDHVMSVNNCTKKAMPQGETLEKLKIALKTMLKLAKG